LCFRLVLLTTQDLDLAPQRLGPLVGGPGGEREPLVLTLQALQLLLKTGDVGVLRGLLLGPLILVAPGRSKGFHDPLFGLGLAR
jgi:hypothetical protein